MINISNHHFPNKHSYVLVRKRNLFCDVSFTLVNICYYRQLLKYIVDRSYCLNPVCPKFLFKLAGISKNQSSIFIFFFYIISLISNIQFPYNLNKVIMKSLQEVIKRSLESLKYF